MSCSMLRRRGLGLKCNSGAARMQDAASQARVSLQRRSHHLGEQQFHQVVVLRVWRIGGVASFDGRLVLDHLGRPLARVVLASHEVRAVVGLQRSPEIVQVPPVARHHVVSNLDEVREAPAEDPAVLGGVQRLQQRCRQVAGVMWEVESLGRDVAIQRLPDAVVKRPFRHVRKVERVEALPQQRAPALGVTPGLLNQAAALAIEVEVVGALRRWVEGE